MVEKDELKDKRDADSRVALLGLAAEVSVEKIGNCLASEEMAELLDGRCEDGQKQLHLKHISLCDICYREWLVLQQESKSTSPVQKKQLLFQRRFLGISGTLMAAAASVVFYLNLDTGPRLHEKLHSDIPVIESEEVIENQESPVQHRSLKTLSQPGSAVKRLKPQPDEQRKNRFQDAQEEMFAVPIKGQSVRAKVTASAMVMTPIRQWLDKIEKNCFEEQSNVAVWQELALQGKNISAVDTFFRLEYIVELVDRLAAGEDQALLCAEIQQTLKEKNHEQQRN